jgi:hypothetical protein
MSATRVDRDAVIRRALWASVAFNLGGVLLFAFPDSIGQLAGFPVPVPRIYTVSLALFVALFAGAYAWLARQPEIDRPLVAFAAIGKAGFFTVVAACWLLGEAPGRGVLGAAGDLVFAVVFAWWLVTTASEQRARPHAVPRGAARDGAATAARRLGRG